MADQSLLAAVSGIQANQTYLDEIGNNIANAETVGYKEGTVQFGDLLSEQVAGGAAPATGSGGVNPIAIGAGVRVAAVTTHLSEGSTMFTGQATDVAITGAGYLVVQSHGQQLYTRDGALTVDASTELTTLSGGRIQGWEANATGVINANAPTGPVTIPKGATIAAHATTKFYVSGNLPAWSGSGTDLPTTVTFDAYDSLGQVIPVTVTFTPVTGKAGEWAVSGKAKGATGSEITLFPPTKTGTKTVVPLVTFTPTSGQIKSITGSTKSPTGALLLKVSKTTMTALGYSFPAGDQWAVDFPQPGTNGAVTQFASTKTINPGGTDGYGSGALESYAIGADGVITGSFSNGKTQALGQLALAGFANPSGLQDVGNGLLATSANSGQPQVGVPGTGTLGSLLGGELEQSNVTLGSQLTDLITAQEAYQANTKVISTTQQVIQSLEAV